MARGRSRKRSDSGSGGSREGTPEPTKKCKHCGRSFAESRVDKHQKICKKTSKRQPKVFESSKQRVKGSDISMSHVKKAQKEPVGPPKTRWRERHNDFQSAVKSAKGGGGGGGRARTPPGYVKCDGCGRKFNERAGERHIPQCVAKNAKENNRDASRRGGGSRERGNSKGRADSRGRGRESPARSGSKDRRGGSHDKGRSGSKSRSDSKRREASGGRRSDSRSRRR